MVFVAGLVLAVTSAALAVTAPPPGISPFTSVQSRNQDNGTSYSGPVDGIAHDPNEAGITKTPARGTIGHEDNWGIFAVHLLSKGALGGDGIAITPDVPVIFSNGDGSNTTWLVGMFYGGVDQSVQFNNPDAGHVSAFEVLSRGTQFDLYAVDPTKLAAGANMLNLMSFSAANRTGAAQYTGWVDPNTTSGATFLMHGTSQYNQFIGQATAALKFDGLTNIYFDVDPNFVNPLTGTTGAWASIAQSNHFPTPKIFAGDPDPNAHLSDIFLTFTDQASQQGWDTFSSDQGGWANAAVPEPLTMIGLFLGVGGLGRYLRRRFA